MPQNLELKARISSMTGAVRAAKNLNVKSKGILRQHDIYYCVPRGRLKLRIINNHKAEMIFYNRPDRKSRRYSDYYILPVADPKLTNKLYTAALGQKAVVDKRRQFFLYKNARIHLDVVCGLGAFIEFEVLVKYGKPQAQKLLIFLSEHFKIKPSDAIPVSYSDLLIQSGKRNEQRLT